MDAPKGFLLDHCDGQCSRGCARAITRGKSRAPQRGERALVRRRLDEAVAWEHEVSGGTYGAPRIRHALARSGVDVGVRARRVDAPPGPVRPEHAPAPVQARRAGPCGP